MILELDDCPCILSLSKTVLIIILKKCPTAGKLHNIFKSFEQNKLNDTVSGPNLPMPNAAAIIAACRALAVPISIALLPVRP
jgi:hypothetical protein